VYWRQNTAATTYAVETEIATATASAAEPAASGEPAPAEPASSKPDLTPVRLSARNAYAAFADATVAALSPIRHLDRTRR
jgi:hypothetical protein